MGTEVMTTWFVACNETWFIMVLVHSKTSLTLFFFFCALQTGSATYSVQSGHRTAGL